MSKWKEFFVSKRLWAGVLGLVVLFAGSLFSGFPDVTEHAVELIVPIVAYIAGASIDPGAEYTTIWAKLLSLVKSRKFWAMVAPVVVSFVRAASPDFPISDDQMTAFIVLISGYILGTGVSDYLKYQAETKVVVVDTGESPVPEIERMIQKSDLRKGNG